jgi:hypothetical protein
MTHANPLHNKPRCGHAAAAFAGLRLKKNDAETERGKHDVDPQRYEQSGNDRRPAEK